MLKRITAGAVLVTCLAAAHATDYVWQHPTFTNIFGNVKPAPLTSAIGIYTSGVGNLGYTFNTWNLGDFTNYYPGTPSDYYQAGGSGVGYGGTSVQLKDVTFGAQLHTWSTPSNSQILNLTYGGSVNIQPWAAGFGSDPSLCLSYFLTVPRQYSEGAVHYVTSMFQVNEPVSNKKFWIEAAIWDARGGGYLTYEGIANTDQNDRMVQTALATGKSYSSPMAYSSLASTGTFSTEKWVGVCISKTNLANMVSDLSAHYQEQWSTAYSDYQVINYGVQPEINRLPAMYNGWFSMTARDMWLMTRY